MNRIFKNLTLLIIGLILICLSSCQEEGKMFRFEASVASSDVVRTNESFDILIKTINASGSDIYYEGSSTIVGATIYLKGKNGEIIRPNDIPVTKDFRKMMIKCGAIIERIWNFEYETIKNIGWYDLYLEFFNSEKIFTDFLYVSE